MRGFVMGDGLGGETHGYDVSTGYTYGFCREMAPGWLDFAARVSGRAAPIARDGRRLRFLELGCGQGQGLCLLAAANPHIDFVGVDFMPEHVAHARKVAQAAGLTNLRMEQADFVALAEAWPDHFGAFDYVALHGVYSWVIPQVREALVTCLAHATVPGSLVYIGYNGQPGWVASGPFRHFAQLIKQTGELSGLATIDHTADLFGRLQSAGAATFKLLPGLAASVNAMKTRNRGYLVHEYLHDSWQAMWHSEVAQDLARADLSFTGTATLVEALLPELLPPPLRDTILAQSDPRLRADVQDFVINQAYRRDLFVRGEAVGGDVAETRLALLAAPGASETLNVRTTFGEMALQPPAHAPISAALSGGSRSVRELAAAQNRPVGETVKLLLMLIHAGTLFPHAANGTDSEAAHRLNAIIARGAAEGMPYDHLAAPVIGAALPVTGTDLLLLDCWLLSGEHGDVDSLAEGLLQRLDRLGRKPAEDPDREAKKCAGIFLGQRLAEWRRLGAIG